MSELVKRLRDKQLHSRDGAYYIIEVNEESPITDEAASRIEELEGAIREYVDEEEKVLAFYRSTSSAANPADDPFAKFNDAKRRLRELVK